VLSVLLSAFDINFLAPVSQRTSTAYLSDNIVQMHRRFNSSYEHR